MDDLIEEDIPEGLWEIPDYTEEELEEMEALFHGSEG